MLKVMRISASIDTSSSSSYGEVQTTRGLSVVKDQEMSAGTMPPVVSVKPAGTVAV